jgi:hypothetical protein
MQIKSNLIKTKPTKHTSLHGNASHIYFGHAWPEYQLKHQLP